MMITTFFRLFYCIGSTFAAGIALIHEFLTNE